MTSNPQADPRAEAIKKWERYKDRDPDTLRSIPPTLLSEAHIRAYAEAVGLLYPFVADKDRFKAASYEVRFGSTFIFWDENGEKHEEPISKAGTFTLPPNSISFVDLESEFLLPRYIAVRFNLRIQHVHRGLLVGTGPLVDPGFRGNLLVPLHNLTSDPYTIRGDEGFIWVEFTKTSFDAGDSAADAPIKTDVELLKEWEDRKNRMTPESYFDKANKNRPIRSSIPVAIQETRKQAARADRAARGAQRANSFFVGLGTLAIAGTVVGLFSFFESVKGTAVSAVSLANDVSTAVIRATAEATERATSAASLATETSAKLESIEDALAETKRDRQDLLAARDRIERLSQEVDALRNELRRQSSR